MLRTLGKSYLKGNHLVFRTKESVFSVFQASGLRCLRSIPHGLCEDGGLVVAPWPVTSCNSCLKRLGP